MDRFFDLYFGFVMLCSLVVTCWERANLGSLVCDFWGIFFTFSCGVLGQMWCLIVSIPDLCLLTYFYIKYSKKELAISKNSIF